MSLPKLQPKIAVVVFALLAVGFIAVLGFFGHGPTGFLLLPSGGSENNALNAVSPVATQSASDATNSTNANQLPAGGSTASGNPFVANNSSGTGRSGGSGGGSGSFQGAEEVSPSNVLPNNPPQITDFSPKENPVILVNAAQEFKVSVSDPETDSVGISWYLDGKNTVNGSAYSFTATSALMGTHEVKVMASDGQSFVSRSWQLTVQSQAPEKAVVLPEEKIHPDLRAALSTRSVETRRVLIQATNEQSLSEIVSLVSAQTGTISGEYKIGDVIVADIPLQKIMELAKNSGVKSIWPDQQVSATLDVSVPLISAPAIWNYGYQGNDVRVAVLDTGIDSAHPVLAGKVVLARNFTTASSVNDVAGHGTHVAGIIAGTSETGGLYNGVAPHALLINAKVLDDSGHGNFSDIINALNWVADPDGNPLTDDGAKVINLSLGGAFSDPNAPIVSTIEQLIQQGITVVISSGNCGEGCPDITACGTFIGVTTPGNSPDAITVGAVDNSKNWACFSSGENIPGIGIKPDLTAPGVSIKSSFPSSRYATLSGTSMAAPHVTGAVALLLEANPSLSPSQIKNLLTLNSIDLGVPGKDTRFGSGMIDLPSIINPRPVLSANDLTANVSLDQVFTQTVRITNYGVRTIQIANLTATSPLNVVLEKQNVDAAQAIDLNVSLNPALVGTGTFNAEIDLNTNAGAYTIPVTLQIMASEKPVVYSLNIPLELFRGETQDIEADVRDDQSVASVHMQFTDPQNIVTDMDLTLAPDNKWKFLLYAFPSAAAAAGRYQVKLSAMDDTGNVTTYQTYFDLVNFDYTLPVEFIASQTAPVSVTYKNTSTSLTLGKTVFSVYDSTGQKVTEDQFTKDVLSGQTLDWNWGWTPGLLGNYVLGIQFYENDSLLEEKDFNFTVVGPQVLQNMVFSMDSNSILKGQNANFTVSVQSNGLTDVNAFAEIYLTQHNGIYRILSSDSKTISAGAADSFSFTEPILLPAGTYAAIARINYNNRALQANQDFNVITPANGKILQVILPAPMYIDGNYLIQVQFDNNGPVPLNAGMEVNLFRGLTNVKTIDLGAATVSSQSTYTFEGYALLTDLAGDYNLQAIASYENNYDETDSNLRIMDNKPPEIQEIEFPSRVYPNDPVVLKLKVKEHSKIVRTDIYSHLPITIGVRAGMPYQGSASAHPITSIVPDSDYNQIVITTEYGYKFNDRNYEYLVNICDEYGNCMGQSGYGIDLSGYSVLNCTDPSVLVVSNDNDWNERIQALPVHYCASYWQPSVSGLPPLNYLQGFDAILWGTGNSLNSIDSNPAALLESYMAGNGKLFLEGADIALQHKDDNFMVNVTHSVLAEEINRSDTNEHLQSIQRHMVNYSPRDLLALPSFDLNTQLSPYPDTVLPVNGGESLAEFIPGKSGLILFAGNAGTKLVFTPFAFNALDTPSRNDLLKNILRWLIETPDSDPQITDVILPSYIIEQQQTPVEVHYTNPGPSMDFIVDGPNQKSLSTLPPNMVQTTLSFTPGYHELIVGNNPEFDFGIKDSNYFNNFYRKTFRVATIDPDPTPLQATFSNQAPKAGETIDINALIANQGGTSTDASVQLWIDGNQDSAQTVNIPYGTSQEVHFPLTAALGYHVFTFKTLSL
ncbi:MAG: S8 family serine peptidase, partial [Candidatus Diapherotrites archaeon]|nr:S8 family serine peptidase [Candidatus Diapherotrites archaeon]